jgi:thiol-disulfide isomerase/thioredoxin
MLKRSIILGGCLGFLLLLGFAALAQTLSAGAVSTDRRSRPGPLVLNGVDTTEVREIDLDGLKKILQRDPKDPRPLLINFWATWCDGCREEFPDLVKIDNDYRGKGLNFISISLDDITDIKTTVPEFLKEMKAQMPVVLLNVKDPEPAIHAVDEKWDGALPATYLYDKDGKVVFKYFGAIKPAELRGAIDKLVGSKQ